MERGAPWYAQETLLWWSYSGLNAQPELGRAKMNEVRSLRHSIIIYGVHPPFPLTESANKCRSTARTKKM